MQLKIACCEIRNALRITVKQIRPRGCPRREINDREAHGRRAGIWGAGSKGVTFLNLVDTQDVLSIAVDINPEKKGMFVSERGQRIVSPEELPAYGPDAVVIMNQNYRDEIERALRELGIEAEIPIA